MLVQILSFVCKELLMGFDKKDITESIIVLKSLKGYSERMGLFADNGCDEICKKVSVPKKFADFITRTHLKLLLMLWNII